MKISHSLVILAVAILFATGSQCAQAIQRGQGLNDRFTPSWDDQVVVVNRSNINPVTMKPDFEPYVDGITQLAWDKSDIEPIEFTLQLPHSYKPGTDIYPHVHYGVNTAGTGNIVFGLSCSSSTTNGTFGSIVTSYVTTTNVGNLVQNYAKFPAIKASPLQVPSTLFICRLWRDAPQDTYDADVFGLSIDFHIQKDRIGSDLELQDL